MLFLKKNKRNAWYLSLSFYHAELFFASIFKNDSLFKQSKFSPMLSHNFPHAFSSSQQLNFYYKSARAELSTKQSSARKTSLCSRLLDFSLRHCAFSVHAPGNNVC
jgi:hypothetical protein